MDLAPEYDIRRVVREMNASPFLNPVCDNILVQFVRSEAMFSRLITQSSYGSELDENGVRLKSTRHVIQMNEAGAYFLHNLVQCLMGDHRDPGLYWDSAFSSTLFMIEPVGKLSLLQMVSRIEREHPTLYARIYEAYDAWQTREQFGKSADSVRQTFYRYVRPDITNISEFAIKLVVRFILGHEIGHYVRKNNPNLRAALEKFFDTLEPGAVQDDSELFCDMLAVFHCFEVSKALKEPIEPQLIVLAIILNFMDAQAVTDPKSSARRTFSGKRFSMLIKYLESLGHATTNRTAEELMFLSTDLDVIFLPSISIVRQVMTLLSEAAGRHSIIPTWYLRTSDYLVRKVSIEE